MSAPAALEVDVLDGPLTEDEAACETACRRILIPMDTLDAMGYDRDERATRELVRDSLLIDVPASGRSHVTDLRRVATAMRPDKVACVAFDVTMKRRVFVAGRRNDRKEQA